MLRKNHRSNAQAPATHHRFAIVASRYNAQYVNGMVKAAQTELQAAGAAGIEVIRVPGAFEIPVVVAHLTRRDRAVRPAAILCLGVILQGATAHAQHIGEAITQALMQLQVDSGIPCVHEVLLLADEAQAKVRCLSRDHNRGTEAAQTAIAMAKLLLAFGDELPF